MGDRYSTHWEVKVCWFTWWFLKSRASFTKACWCSCKAVGRPYGKLLTKFRLAILTLLRLKQQKLRDVVNISVLSRLSGMGRFGNRAKKAEEPFGFSSAGFQSRRY